MRDLTPDRYRKELEELEMKIRDSMERGRVEEGILKEAERLILLKERFPEIYSQFAYLEGLLGELLALRERKKFF